MFILSQSKIHKNLLLFLWLFNSFHLTYCAILFMNSNNKVGIQQMGELKEGRNVCAEGGGDK